MCGTIDLHPHLLSKMFPVSSRIFRVGDNEFSGILLPNVSVGKDEDRSQKCCMKKLTFIIS
jgi:hypothetical protein